MKSSVYRCVSVLLALTLTVQGQASDAALLLTSAPPAHSATNHRIFNDQALVQRPFIAVWEFFSKPNRFTFWKQLQKSKSHLPESATPDQPSDILRTFLLYHPDSEDDDRRLIEEAEAHAKWLYGTDVEIAPGKTRLQYAKDRALTMAESGQSAIGIAAAFYFPEENEVNPWMVDYQYQDANFPTLRAHIGQIEKLRRGLREIISIPFDPEIPKDNKPDYTLQYANNWIIQKADSIMAGPEEHSSEEDLTALLCLTLAHKRNIISLLSSPEHKPALQKLYNEIRILYAPLADRIGLPFLSEDLRFEAWKHLYPDEYERIEKELQESQGMNSDELGDQLKEVQAQIVEKTQGIPLVVRKRVKNKYKMWEKQELAKEALRVDPEERPATLEHQYDVNGIMLIADDEEALSKLIAMDLEENLGTPDNPTHLDLDYLHKPIRRLVEQRGKPVYRTIGFWYHHPTKPGEKIRVELQMMTKDYYKNFYLLGTTSAKYARAHWMYKARLSLALFLHPEKPVDPKPHLGQQFDHRDFIPEDLPVEHLIGPVGITRRVGAIRDSLVTERFVMCPAIGNRFIKLPAGSIPADFLRRPENHAVDPSRSGVFRMKFALQPDGSFKSVSQEKLGAFAPLRGGEMLAVVPLAPDQILEPCWPRPDDTPEILHKYQSRVKTSAALLGLDPYEHDKFERRRKAGQDYLESRYGDTETREFRDDVLTPAIAWLGLTNEEELFQALGAANEVPRGVDSPYAQLKLDFLAWYDQRFIDHTIESITTNVRKNKATVTTSIDENQVGVTVGEIRHITEAGWSVQNIEVRPGSDGKIHTTFFVAQRRGSVKELDNLRAALRSYRRHRGARPPEDEGRRLNANFFLRKSRHIGQDTVALLQCLTDLGIDLESIERDERYPEWLSLIVRTPRELKGHRNEDLVSALQSVLGEREEIQKDQVEIGSAPTTAATLWGIVQMLIDERNRLPDQASKDIWPLDEDKLEGLKKLANGPQGGLPDTRLLIRMRRLIRFLYRYEGDISGDNGQNWYWANVQRRHNQAAGGAGTPYAIYPLAVLYQLILEIGVDDPVTLVAAGLRDVRRHGPNNVLLWVHERLNRMEPIHPDRTLALRLLTRRFPPLKGVSALIHPGFPESRWRSPSERPTDGEIKAYVSQEIALALNTEFPLYGDALEQTLSRVEREGYAELLENGSVNEVANRLAGREFNLRDLLTFKPQEYEGMQAAYAKEQLSETVRWFLPLIMKKKPSMVTVKTQAIYYRSRVDFLKALMARTTETAARAALSEGMGPAASLFTAVAEREERQEDADQATLLAASHFLAWVDDSENQSTVRQLDPEHLATFRAQLEDLVRRLTPDESDLEQESHLTPQERLKGFLWALAAAYAFDILVVAGTILFNPFDVARYMSDGMFLLMCVAIAFAPSLIAYMAYYAAGKGVHEVLGHVLKALEMDYQQVGVIEDNGHWIVVGKIGAPESSGSPWRDLLRWVLVGPIPKSERPPADWSSWRRANWYLERALGPEARWQIATQLRIMNKYVRLAGKRASKIAFYISAGLTLAVMAFFFTFLFFGPPLHPLVFMAVWVTLVGLGAFTAANRCFVFADNTKPVDESLSMADQKQIVRIPVAEWRGSKTSSPPEDHARLLSRLIKRLRSDKWVLERELGFDEDSVTLAVKKVKKSTELLQFQHYVDGLAAHMPISPRVTAEGHRRALYLQMSNPKLLAEFIDYIEKDLPLPGYAGQRIRIEKADVLFAAGKSWQRLILVGPDQKKDPRLTSRLLASIETFADSRDIKLQTDTECLLDDYGTLEVKVKESSSDTQNHSLKFYIEGDIQRPGTLELITRKFVEFNANIEHLDVVREGPRAILNWEISVPVSSPVNFQMLIDAFNREELPPLGPHSEEAERRFRINFYIPDVVGTFHQVFKKLSDMGINVESARLDKHKTHPHSHWVDLNIVTPGTDYDELRAALLELNYRGPDSDLQPLIYKDDIQIAFEKVSEASAVKAAGIIRKAIVVNPDIEPMPAFFSNPSGRVDGVFIRNVEAAIRILMLANAHPNYIDRPSGFFRWMPPWLTWPIRFLWPNWYYRNMGPDWLPAAPQMRKSNPNEPYAEHPLRVAWNIITHGVLDQLGITGCLSHDWLEDAHKNVWAAIHGNDKEGITGVLEKEIRGELSWQARREFIARYRAFLPDLVDELTFFLDLARERRTLGPSMLTSPIPVLAYHMAMAEVIGERYQQFHANLVEGVNSMLYELIESKMVRYPLRVIDDMEWLSKDADDQTHARNLIERGSEYLLHILFEDQLDNLKSALNTGDPSFGPKIAGKNVRNRFAIAMSPNYPKDKVSKNILRAYVRQLFKTMAGIRELPLYYEWVDKTARIAEDITVASANMIAAINIVLEGMNDAANSSFLPPRILQADARDKLERLRAKLLAEAS